MKLVDILARELSHFPANADFAEQISGGHIIFTGKGSGVHVGCFFGVPHRGVTIRSDADCGPVTREQWQAAVDALKDDADTQWNGEGLPPVGAACEWAGCTFAPEDPEDPDLHVGDQTTIIAHFKDGEFDLAAFTFNPQIHNPDRGTAWVNQGAKGCFRPIRTAEQVKADERDREIADLYFTINWAESRDTWPVISSGRKADYARVIDAGYRKHPK